MLLTHTVSHRDLVDIRASHSENKLLRNAWDSVSVDWDVSATPGHPKALLGASSILSRTTLRWRSTKGGDRCLCFI